MNKDYENAIDLMAQQTLEDFDLEAMDNYLHEMAIDCDDRDLILFINLAEDGRIVSPSGTVSTILTLYRSKHPSFSYRSVIEDHIRDTWEDSLDPLPRLAVRYVIDRGGIVNADSLMGGAFEAEADFIQSVCKRIFQYLKKAI